MTGPSAVGQYRAVAAYLSTITQALQNAETTNSPAPAGLRRGLVRTHGALWAVLGPHQLNHRGRCPACRTRLGVPGPCALVPVLAAYLLSPLPVVWWQILAATAGPDDPPVTMTQVSTWLGVDPATGHSGKPLHTAKNVTQEL
ncbi:hypothetical protein M8C13_25715 [Crossiella sp. SN42]|uniref:hypothetical protein n=1 Tax=Crossiella sp. SN42 TaxID=2944808 RepID=UPI00207D14E9|nr:hypothetical protein [Crossiella sp. SN42]MCO1579152.1 hypothetical protein [Crossiella sp. SN42]